MAEAWELTGDNLWIEVPLIAPIVMMQVTQAQQQRAQMELAQQMQKAVCPNPIATY